MAPFYVTLYSNVLFLLRQEKYMIFSNTKNVLRKTEGRFAVFRSRNRPEEPGS